MYLQKLWTSTPWPAVCRCGLKSIRCCQMHSCLLSMGSNSQRYSTQRMGRAGNGWSPMLHYLQRCKITTCEAVVSSCKQQMPPKSPTLRQHRRCGYRCYLSRLVRTMLPFIITQRSIKIVIGVSKQHVISALLSLLQFKCRLLSALWGRNILACASHRLQGDRWW